MRKTVYLALLTAFALVGCGNGGGTTSSSEPKSEQTTTQQSSQGETTTSFSPAPSTYEMNEDEWNAAVNRIKTGNVEATFTSVVHAQGGDNTGTIIYQATATKVHLKSVTSAITFEQLIVNDSENYTMYVKYLEDWIKTPSTKEDFDDLKKNVFPVQFVYSNFQFDTVNNKYKNINPYVVLGTGTTNTYTNIVVSTKEVSFGEKTFDTMSADVTQTYDDTSKDPVLGEITGTYVLKDLSFDIDVPVVE